MIKILKFGELVLGPDDDIQLHHFTVDCDGASIGGSEWSYNRFIVLAFNQLKAAYDLAFAAGVEQERERCAQIAEQVDFSSHEPMPKIFQPHYEYAARKCGAAIRAAASEAPPQRSSK